MLAAEGVRFWEHCYLVTDLGSKRSCKSLLVDKVLHPKFTLILSSMLVRLLQKAWDLLQSSFPLPEKEVFIFNHLLWQKAVTKPAKVPSILSAAFSWASAVSFSISSSESAAADPTPTWAAMSSSSSPSARRSQSFTLTLADVSPCKILDLSTSVVFWAEFKPNKD